LQPISIAVGFGLAAFAVAGGWAAARATAMLSEKRVSLSTAMAVCGVVALWAAVAMPWTFLLPITLGFGWLLVVAATVDALEFRLPDILTLSIVATGLGVAALVAREQFLSHLIGAAVGYAVFAGFAFAYRKLRGRDGLGMGDAKLIAGGGAWLGWEALPSIVLVASVLGLLWYGVLAIMRGRGALAERIPFGVPLCLAIWIIWLYGPLLNLLGPN